MNPTSIVKKISYLIKYHTYFFIDSFKKVIKEKLSIVEKKINESSSPEQVNQKFIEKKSKKKRKGENDILLGKQFVQREM